MQRSLLQAVSSQRRKSCSRCLPTIHSRIHLPLRSWLGTLPALTRAASIFSTASCTKSLPKRESFVSCVCGRTMSKLANPSINMGASDKFVRAVTGLHVKRSPRRKSPVCRTKCIQLINQLVNSALRSPRSMPINVFSISVIVSAASPSTMKTSWVPDSPCGQHSSVSIGNSICWMP